MSTGGGRRPLIILAFVGGRHQVLSAILSRTSRQIAIGVLVGGAITLLLLYSLLVGSSTRPALTVTHVGLFSAFLLAMAGVCLLAALVPTMRALRIHPTEALKAEA